jgi:uncharacterized membrane protein
MKVWFEFVALFCTGVFAGAAAYITLVEHPARMECGTALALAEFGPTYRRAALMQASLAVVAFVAAIGAWVCSSTFAWLLGGLLIAAVIPFTLIVIRPTNKQLLDPSLDRDSDNARRLLTRWGRLHAVRTVLSLAAFLLFLMTPLGAHGDGRLRAKERELRQDLFILRSIISQYTLDKQKAPKSLDDLVQAGYIQKIPLDPMTGSNSSWTVDQQDPGIRDVHSGASQISSYGDAYSTW